MKEKIKNQVFAISIFYSVIVIFLMISSLTSATTSVELYDSEENKTKLNEYKKEIATLNQNECTSTINKIVRYYENTSYNGKVDLKDIYNIEEGFLSYFGEMKDNCNLTDEQLKKYNLPNKFISSTIHQEEMFTKYYFQYELNFSDILNRTIIEPSLYNTEYEISKNTQLEIISILIDISKEVVVNE